MFAGVEWVDGRLLLESATQQLEEGQVIKSVDLGFMDLIGAVDIMDPRTDSFMAIVSEEYVDTVSPGFKPNLDLQSTELLWILDEMLKLEVTFHDGHPLTSTLFRCQYIRPAAIRELAEVLNEERPNPVSAENTTFMSLMKMILLASIMGTIKCTEIIWEELCKGQVYDNEDVHLSTSCLTFQDLLAAGLPYHRKLIPRDPPQNLSENSILRVPQHNGEIQKEEEVQDIEVTIDEVLDMLEKAKSDVMKEVDEGLIKDALLYRLAFRIVSSRLLPREPYQFINKYRQNVQEFLYTLGFLSSPPNLTPSQIRQHLLAIMNNLTPELIDGSQALSSVISPPSNHLKAIFESGRDDVPLPSPKPVRDVIGQIYDIQLAWEEIENFVKGLNDITLVWEGWISSRERGTSGWPCVMEHFTMLGRQSKLDSDGKEKEAMKPYVRSIHQSIVMTSRNLFGQYIPMDLPVSFFQCHIVAFDSVAFFNYLLNVRSTERSWDSCGRKVLGWYDKLATQALGVGIPGGGILGWSSQNRARGRRGMVKTLGCLNNLIEEWEIYLTPLLAQNKDVTRFIREGSAVDRTVKSILLAFAVALRTILYHNVLEALLSGFELDLYEQAGGQEEWRQVWWVGARVAGYLAEMYGKLATEAGASKLSKSAFEKSGDEALNYVKVKAAEAESLRWMCRAAFLNTYVDPSIVTKLASPFLKDSRISKTNEDEHTLELLLVKSRFERRFQWLANAGQLLHANCADWVLYRDEQHQREENGTNEGVIQECLKAYHEALEHCKSLPLPEADVTGSSVRWYATYKNMASSNESILQIQLKQDEEERANTIVILKWELPWIPTYIMK